MSPDREQRIISGLGMQQDIPQMSRKRLLGLAYLTGHGGSADSHSAEGKEEVSREKTLKREMYGQPAQKRRLSLTSKTNKNLYWENLYISKLNARK